MPCTNPSRLDANKEILGCVAFTLTHYVCQHIQCRQVKPKKVCVCVRDKKNR